MNTEIIGTAKHNGLLEFFNTMVEKGALTNQDLADYKAGKKIFYTADLYVRKYLSSAAMTGNVEVITENEVEFTTRCNLSKGRIPDEMNLIVSHFGLRYGESLTAGDITTPEIVDYTDQMYDIADIVADAGRSAVSGGSVLVRRIPIPFCNADYEVKCDDGLIDKGRVGELLSRGTTSYYAQGNAQNKKMYFWPKLLPSGKTLRLTLKFPTVGSWPASTYFFVEATWKGMYLGKRPGA